jgi:hypothetical protein
MANLPQRSAYRLPLVSKAIMESEIRISGPTKNVKKAAKTKDKWYREISSLIKYPVIRGTDACRHAL